MMFLFSIISIPRQVCAGGQERQPLEICVATTINMQLLATTIDMFSNKILNYVACTHHSKTLTTYQQAVRH